MLNETVVIIGGGITGLTSAWLLEEAGFRDIHLLEASDYLGGKIKTIRESGFLIETGPDALMVTKPGIRPFLRKLGLEDQLIEPESRHFYILHKGRLQAVPAGFASMVPADIPDFLKSPLLSWRGKARMLAERLVPSRKQNRDESLAAFVERRFGHEVLTQLAEPLFSGVYAAPASPIFMRWSASMVASQVRCYPAVSRTDHPAVLLFGVLKRGWIRSLIPYLHNLSTPPFGGTRPW